MDIQKLYGNNDMVKVGCRDCMGCCDCCRDMGNSIWLDPYDVWQLTKSLSKSFEMLLQKEVELHVESGLILPNIHMRGEDMPQCSFLDADGRCSIHAFRPGLCRLFPLGRNYENGRLSYFLLEDACPVPNKSKQKINKWLGIPRLKEYEQFLTDWHALTKQLRTLFADGRADETVIKAINLYFLQTFYMDAYSEKDFYPQFELRMQKMKDYLQKLGIC